LPIAAPPPPVKASGAAAFPAENQGKRQPSGRVTHLDASLQPPRRATQLQKSNCAAITGRPNFKRSRTHFILMSALLLSVEDNELDRDMPGRRLERKGYVIQMAADGAQGVSMATELRPALILMDLRFPVLDGWEAIRRLKAGSTGRWLT